jgi:hypothetical protein
LVYWTFVLITYIFFVYNLLVSYYCCLRNNGILAIIILFPFFFFFFFFLILRKSIALRYAWYMPMTLGLYCTAEIRYWDEILLLHFLREFGFSLFLLFFFNCLIYASIYNLFLKAKADEENIASNIKIIEIPITTSS